MSILYFIRHGQASFGTDNYDRLSETGREQSRILARHVAKRKITFDLTVSGSLERQQRTADSFFEGASRPEHLVFPELNEYDSRAIMTALTPSVLEEKPELQKDARQLFTDRKSFQRVFEAVMLRWVSGNHSDDLGSFADFAAGINRSIDRLMADYGRGKTIGVFTSGGPISTAVQRALGFGNEEVMRINWQVANTSLTRFRCTERQFSLLSFNEYGHLESAGDEYITFR